MTIEPTDEFYTQPQSATTGGQGLLNLAIALAGSWKLLLIGPLVVGGIAYGLSYLMSPIFTARTSVLPPQQQQSAAASALASLGALSGLAGGSTRTLADQYAALLQSETIEDALIDQFKLKEIYGVKFRSDARRMLEQNVRISSGKKDGLIVIEVDDTSPVRAAELANQHVEGLRRLTAHLALTEAQQRRIFFQAQVAETRDKLTAAQLAMQASGFNAGALRSEPRAAAEGYARIKAEITSNEVKLQSVRRVLTDVAPEVQQLQAAISTLREQLSRLETTTVSPAGPDYISKYREFKYQETLFELFSRQYEISRLDESRESALIQVVDVATAPERKSKPKRAIIGFSVTFASLLLLIAFVLVRHSWRQSANDDNRLAAVGRLKAALLGR